VNARSTMTHRAAQGEVLAQLAEIVATSPPRRSRHPVLLSRPRRLHVNDSPGTRPVMTCCASWVGACGASYAATTCGHRRHLSCSVVRDVSSVADAYTLAEKLRLRAAVPSSHRQGRRHRAWGARSCARASVDELVARAGEPWRRPRRRAEHVVVVLSSPPAADPGTASGYRAGPGPPRSSRHQEGQSPQVVRGRGSAERPRVTRAMVAAAPTSSSSP
jgi:hypothetical protein